MSEKNPIQVADRLFGAVEYLASRGSAGLMEVADALELNKSTAHRILTSLVYMGYVSQEERTGRYQLTAKIVRLSQQVVSRLDVPGLVRPYLTELSERAGETVHFVRRDGVYAVYLDKIVSDRNAIQMVSQIGSRIPLYCSGVGKAIASELSDDEVREIWKASPVEKLTPHTITNYADFSRAIRQIRLQGYAEDLEENEPGVRCVAASIGAADGRCEYAFSISAPVTRMTDERVKELAGEILMTKRQIAEILGS